MADNEPAPATAKAKGFLQRVAHELGLDAILLSPLDTKILCFQRFVRLFAYGGSTLILATFLSDLNISDRLIGLFMTLTLVGDVFISFGLTLIADQLGRRRILAIGALMMAGSGIVFGLASNYYILLAAAIFGVITPSGNEIGPFRAVEESALAHLTKADDRPHTFAWYGLIGTGGVALGIVTCGWAITLLIEKNHWSPLEAYRTIFLAYAVLGGIKFLLSLCLSKKCEAEKPAKNAGSSETEPLLANGSNEAPSKPKKKFSLFAHISKESRPILIQLCLLFALDSFASGLAPMSWVTYYFRRKFSLPEGRLGTVFFATSIIQAVSVLFAASLARRIGNVKTMVFTHLPSAVCLGLLGFPSQLWLAIALVALRASTQSMDTAPRSAFLSAIVLPNERTAVMGLVNVVKTASQSMGPLITGILADKNSIWVAFLLAGALKATYDIGMLLTFAGNKERRAAERTESA